MRTFAKRLAVAETRVASKLETGRRLFWLDPEEDGPELWAQCRAKATAEGKVCTLIHFTGRKHEPQVQENALAPH